MNFPANRLQLESAGWKEKYSRPCKLCKTPLEFWQTPEMRLAPMEIEIVHGEWIRIPHFSRCPHAEEFRRAKQHAPAAPAKQGELW